MVQQQIGQARPKNMGNSYAYTWFFVGKYTHYDSVLDCTQASLTHLKGIHEYMEAFGKILC